MQAPAIAKALIPTVDKWYDTHALSSMTAAAAASVQLALPTAIQTGKTSMRDAKRR